MRLFYGFIILSQALFANQLYPNNLKNRFLSASVLPQNSCLHLRLASRQRPFAPDKNFEEPPCQNPDSLSCLDMDQHQCKDFVKRELPTITGWCSPRKAEAMMDLIFEVAPEICVELGVFGGSSLFPTAYALKYLNHGVVFGIDAWSSDEAIRYYPEGSIHRDWWARQNMTAYYYDCIQLIEKHQLRPFCILFKESFKTALRKISSIDILHIDATHTNEGDFIDVMPYILKVKKMGHIWFDGWPNSPDTYEYLKSRCLIKKVLNSGNCILLQKIIED